MPVAQYIPTEATENFCFYPSSCLQREKTEYIEKGILRYLIDIMPKYPPNYDQYAQMCDSPFENHPYYTHGTQMHNVPQFASDNCYTTTYEYQLEFVRLRVRSDNK